MLHMDILIFSHQTKDLEEISLLIQQCMFQQNEIKKYQINSFDHHIPFINQNRYDAAFIYINDHDNQTLDIVKSLKNKNPHCIIFFISNSYQYIYKAFQIKVFQYIIKPINIQLFQDEIQRMLLTYKKRNMKFMLHTTKGKILFRTKDIVYIETYYNRIKIVTEEETYITNIKQKDKIRKILSTLCFVKIQRSYIINMQQIKYFTKTGVLLKNKSFLPISPLRKQEIMLEYNKFQNQ